MRQLLPVAVDDVGLDELARSYAYPDGGCVRANMVSSLDGAVTVDGRSAPISGPPDTWMFGFLRAMADVILVGAGTARTEAYGPGRARPEFAHLRAAAGQLDAPVMAVVTRTGYLDPASDLFAKARHRTILVTCSSATEDRLEGLRDVADVIMTPGDAVDLAAAINELRDRGFSRILCEGGPHLLGDLAAAGLLDELAWAISPVVAGGDATRILIAEAAIEQRMQLRSVHEDGGFLFTRYARANDTVRPR